MNIVLDKPTRLFLVLAGFFITNAVVAEFIGMKIFSLEKTLGIATQHWSLFGISGTLDFSAGVLLWPIVFVTTDIINEYYGRRGVRMLSYLAAALIAYAFVMVYFAIGLSPTDWWLTLYSKQQVPDLQAAFAAIFGQSNWIIVGSLVAFLVGQVLDAFIFYRLKMSIGKQLWIRALLSTLVSQCIDSFIVLYIAFVIGPQHWDLSRFWAIGTVNYSYKFLMAIALIPLLYLIHRGIEWYLGSETAEKLKSEAMLGPGSMHLPGL